MEPHWLAWQSQSGHTGSTLQRQTTNQGLVAAPQVKRKNVEMSEEEPTAEISASKGHVSQKVKSQ